jgi:hypothetical protein
MLSPDTKDWTWVLTRPCPDCGFVASATERGGFGDAVRANAAAFADALSGPGATRRPTPDVWSATEYACHVRDVHTIFDQRVRSMLDRDEPTFPNWDQDETAVEQRYDLQDPGEVAPALLAAADQVAATYDAVPDGAWERRGLRSNGSEFTVDSIARYHLHDVVHHLWDVTR